MDAMRESDRKGRGERAPAAERSDAERERSRARGLEELEGEGARAVPPDASEHDVVAPETAREPVPDVRHEPEPDAANIIPAKEQPGTL